MPPREILIEIQRIGTALRVSAIDTATGTEVIFQAPGNTGEASLKKLAADKIAYVMKKRQA